MVGALFHSLLGIETAAEEGKKVILMMLAVGGVFVLVIALGQLTHWLGSKRGKH